MVVEFFMTNGKKVTVDDVDSDLALLRWNLRAYAYAGRSYGPLGQQHSILLHRVILARVLGRPLEKGEFVDHINGDTLNNCRSNLRLATREQNARNRRGNKNSISGYKGVTLHKPKNMWMAGIGIDGRHINLGYFDTAEAAAYAYNEAAKEYFGEFARLNILPDDFVFVRPSRRKPGRAAKPKLPSNKPVRPNRRNRQVASKNKSGYRGVTWNKANKKWNAQIVANGRTIYLGGHFDIEDAARTYNEAAIRYFGEKAILNVLPQKE